MGPGSAPSLCAIPPPLAGGQQQQGTKSAAAATKQHSCKPGVQPSERQTTTLAQSGGFNRSASACPWRTHTQLHQSFSTISENTDSRNRSNETTDCHSSLLRLATAQDILGGYTRTHIKSPQQPQSTPANQGIDQLDLLATDRVKPTLTPIRS